LPIAGKLVNSQHPFSLMPLSLGMPLGLTEPRVRLALSTDRSNRR
jgi:hypothetical protein